MDQAMLWVTLVGSGAAVAAAAFAYVQAKVATDNRRDAEDARNEARLARDESARLAGEANVAFIRQAEAQEHANRLKEKELAPPDWSAVHVRGAIHRGTNTSGRLLIVERFEVQPDESIDCVSIYTTHEDGQYAYGDSFEFTVIKAFGANVEADHPVSIRGRCGGRLAQLPHLAVMRWIKESC